MSSRRPPAEVAQLRQTTVSTPTFVQPEGRLSGNRDSIAGNLQNYEHGPASSDDSQYSATTSSKLSNQNAAPASFSQPQPGGRNFRNSSTNSTAYPATLVSRRNTAATTAHGTAAPPALDTFPQVPRHIIQNAQRVPQVPLSSPTAATGNHVGPRSGSPKEVSPLLNNNNNSGSPESERNISPMMDRREPIRMALDAITEDRAVNAARPGTRLIASSSSLGPHSSPHQQPRRDQYRVSMPQNAPATYANPYGRIPESPESSSRPSPVMEEYGSGTQYANTVDQPGARDTLVHVDPTGNPHLPPLTFKPPILRPFRLILFALHVGAVTGALAYAAIRSNKNSELWEYKSFGDTRYFIFQYLPTIVGMSTLFWLFEIQIALHRIAPFIALASDSHRPRSRGTLLPIYPSGFLLPTLQHSAAGQYPITLFMCISWLFLATIPLLASCFNVYQKDQKWYWLANQSLVWATVALHGLLILATVLLMLYLRKRVTGLKWDPRTLADMLVLISHSNLLDEYAGYTEDASSTDMRNEIEARGDRLGYWCLAHANQNDARNIFHTFGAPTLSQVPASPFSISRLVNTDKRPKTLSTSGHRPRFSHDPRTFNGHSKMSYSSTAVGEEGGVDEYLPWFLRPISTLLWAFLAFGLLVAFVVLSYLPSTAIRKGFLPQIPVPVDSEGFGSANFLWSFVPAVLGLLCFLFWYSIDLNLRRLQLYASLSRPEGEEAVKSILQEYVSSGIGLVTISAFRNRHIRIALATLTTLQSAALPILAGGIFWSQFFITQQRILVSAQMPAFYALSGFVALYAAAYIFLLPKSARKAQSYSIPNPVNSHWGMTNRGRSLIELMALTQHSRLLIDPAIRDASSHVIMETRLRTPYAELRKPGTPGTPGGHGGGSSPGAGGGGGGGGNPLISSPIQNLDQQQQQQGQARTAELFEPVKYGIGTFIGSGNVDRWGIDRVKRGGVVVMSVRCP